jgi:hypothetical protein
MMRPGPSGGAGGTGEGDTLLDDNGLGDGAMELERTGRMELERTGSEGAELAKVTLDSEDTAGDGWEGTWLEPGLLGRTLDGLGGVEDEDGATGLLGALLEGKTLAGGDDATEDGGALLATTDEKAGDEASLDTPLESAGAKEEARGDEGGEGPSRLLTIAARDDEETALLGEDSSGEDGSREDGIAEEMALLGEEIKLLTRRLDGGAEEAAKALESDDGEDGGVALDTIGGGTGLERALLAEKATTGEEAALEGLLGDEGEGEGGTADDAAGDGEGEGAWLLGACGTILLSAEEGDEDEEAPGRKSTSR